MADIAINPVDRRVQFTGNTGTGPFSFTFNILADEDLAVYKNTTLLTLTTDYTVTINANGTGSITLVSALILTDVLTIIGGRELSRTTDFVTAGDLLAASLNEQLDSLVIMAQQLDEKLGRAVKVNPGDVFTDLELPGKDTRKGTVLGFNETTGDPEAGPNISDVQSLAAITADIATLADIEDGTDATDAIQTVAGISSNVTTVSGISGNVTTVAGISSDVTAVAADATDIGTVSTNIANVNTVAGISGNVTTVAGISADVTAVAGDATDIGTVSANIANVNTVAGISSDVTTVAADGTDIGTVATNISNVNTVAGISGNVTTVAGQTTNLQNVTDNLAAIQNAATNAANAASSASSASTSATNAASSASAASASQVAAAASAASAANSYDLFDDRYLGTKTSDPTLDNDGNALVAGALYFNSTANEMRVYDGGNWIAASSAGGASILEYRYTATAAQTTFSGADDNANTLSYTQDNLIVTLNGVVLENGADYTATTGTSVVLSSGAALNDELNIIAFKSFTTADMVPASTGGTFYNSIAISGDLTVDTNTLYVDSTNNNVGIGTTSPAQELDVNGQVRGVDRYYFKRASDNYSLSALARWDGSTGSPLTGTAGIHTVVGSEEASGSVIFAPANVEKMRLDASGNLLVGKTTTAFGTQGARIDNAGGGYFTANGGISMQLNRLNSDGEILRFYKDGTTVGSIGSVVGARLRVDSNSTAGYLGIAGTDRYYWNNTEFGATTDNAYNLGYPTQRFKDLYLSGGVYLGGTGAANYLDDYEEGTWTPGVYYVGNGVSATMTNAEGAYTKIGRLVNVVGMFIISSTNSGSGVAQLNNLPFTVADVVANTGVEASGVVSYFASLGTNVNTITLAAVAGSVRAELYNGTTASSAVGSTVSTFNANAQIRFSLTYYTT